MKKLLGILLLITFYLSACSNGGNIDKIELEKSQYRDLSSSYNEEHINMEMKLVQSLYETKPDNLLLQITNSGESVVTFGKPYQIEKFKDDTWYEIPFKEDIAFIEIALVLNPDESYEELIDTKVLKYQLTPGEYRVIKTFFTEDKTVTLDADFQIK